MIVIENPSNYICDDYENLEVRDPDKTIILNDKGNLWIAKKGKYAESEKRYLNLSKEERVKKERR